MAKLTVPIKVDALDLAKGHAQEFYEKGYQQGGTDAIEKFAHELKETMNQEFPRNYQSTQPFFTLENVRMLIDAKAEELKKE